MKKKLLLMGLSLIAMVIVGCGQVAQQTGGEIANVPEVNQSVIASSKIKISMTQGGGGIAPSSVETNIISTQSVEIEANVPDFMTFDAQSSIFFNVDHMGMIVADGVITLNVKYNDLLASTLQDVRVRAYMFSGDGLTGQTQAHVIPLDMELVAQKPYTGLTEAETDMKIWGQPYDQAINETLIFKLRGDFSHAFNQLYKGTVILDFVRNDEVNLEEGLVAYYPFSGNAIDESVNSNNATVNGATLTIDRFGNASSAYRFDGVDDQINIPVNLSSIFNPGDDITFSLWFKADNINSGNSTNGQFILGGIPGGGPDFAVAIPGSVDDPDNVGKIKVRLYGGETGGLFSDNVVIDDKWHHVVWGVGSGSTYFYVDGVRQREVIDIGQFCRTTSILLGARMNPARDYYLGDIDDMRLYNRSLNEFEIQKLYLGN